MVDASELFGTPTPMGSDLLEGMKTVAIDQKVKFSLYGRVILPADGFAFWVKAQLLKQKPFQPSNLVTAEQLSEEQMEACTVAVLCSLHFTTDFRQEEAENYAANRMVMTTKEEIQQLNDIAAGTMYIGEFEGIKFAFSSQTMRYRQAGLWHYSGFALYPDMATQVIDAVEDFSADLVVSNSLPAWLAIQSYQPVWAFWQPLPVMFPSFLAPDNETPPFITVHINPEGTQALASAPTIDQPTQSHVQLASDTVRVTLWGVRNAGAMDFIDAVYDYCQNSGVLGLMNSPIIRDEKRTQAEMRTIAQKKSVDFHVSYLQGTMRAVARQVIKSAIPNLYLTGETTRFSPPPPSG
jgi:hypothetical protein